jgi:hypothetical protein
MQANTLACRSATEVQEPRFSSCRTKILNPISIWFNQEQCLGVS